ncbi:acid protease [Tothia fuscella]|uniref:Acid protease n=1 Tax=Tothia fuscella TaxID=1048955 RepID=A0A9P4NZJ4_9PEZI|nr:acid protease [Tothia fuscella]
MAAQLSLLSLSILSLLTTSNALALPENHLEVRGLQSLQIEKTAAAAPDAVTNNYLVLEKSNMSSISNAVLSSLQQANGLRKRQDGSTPLIPLLGGAEFVSEVTIGSQTVKMIMDTGSSDTWLIKEGFECTDSNRKAVDESTCNFGPTYDGTITQIAGQDFQISYGDGEFVTGVFGTQDVEIAGITVQDQQVALGTSAFWNGDGISSGLVGLAYPAITSAFKGNTRISYDPLFTSMTKQGLSSSMFSMAIQRGGQTGGFIAFGGLPPVTFDETFAKTPIQVLTSGGSSQRTFYTITPDALVYTGSAKTQKSQYIVDSGTTLAYLPTNVAKTLNGLFTPKARLDPSQGAYVVNCNAKAPSLGVKIGGTTFNINPADMVLRDPSGLCISGIQDGGSGPFILGDVFMQNVVAVFDVGAAEMRFAAHDY